MRNGIACAGNWIVDRVKIIDTWPPEEKLSNILSETRGGGGGAHNVSTDLSMMKAPFPIHAIGLIGDDEDGRWLREKAKGDGIDVTGLTVTREQATGYTDVMSVKSTGRRTFFTHQGANQALRGRHVDPGNCRIFYLGYLLLLDAIDAEAPELLARIRKMGIKTAVDVVSAANDRYTQVVTPALEHIDYLVLNELEAGGTTGHEIRRSDGSLDREALLASARALRRDNLVVVHVPEGAQAAGPDGERFSPARPVEQIKSTLGAGDAFCSGMLYGLHEGWPIDRCMDLAHRAAAASLSHESTTGGLRPADELLKG